ncbi:MAG TPA: alpha/beta fold hydrolase, partial [Xanthomonadales bacterium]|nr:alpha/beta fold hydrolase [Xanthomonadales bacterium]
MNFHRSWTALTTLILSVILLAACSEQATETASSTPAEAAPTESTPAVEEAASEFETYNAEAFFATTTYFLADPDGYAFSPDGNKLLYTSDESGIFNVYVADLANGEKSQLSQSTSNAYSAESFFPQDERVLFSADEGGNELDHIWVRELDGTVRDLTATENTRALFAGWAGDGSRFYVMTNERDEKAMDLYAYSAEDYAREMVYQNDLALQISAVSNDGRWIAMVKSRTSADSDVYLADASLDEEPKLITEHEGNISYGVYAFTPDSSQLILSTNEHGEWNQAWAYEIESGEMSEYLAADWDVQFVGYSQTGKYRHYGVNADAEAVVTIAETSSGTPVSLPDLPNGNIRNVRFSNDDLKVAFLLNADTIPSDIFVVDLEANEAERLTNALNPAINPDLLVESEVVRYESFDGLEIPSILYKPKQASAENKVPAIVWVHGGPGGQTTKGYSAARQHLVNHGYAILGANNRGSSGYGKTFFHMDDKRHGEEDLKDIVWGRKYLESLDWVDSENIGVLGGSYGGYMVAAALAFHPDAFDVGINIFGVTNWVRTLTSIPPWWESFKEALYDEMGDPATDEERHRS